MSHNLKAIEEMREAQDLVAQAIEDAIKAVHLEWLDAQMALFVSEGASAGAPWRPLKAATERRPGRPLRRTERLYQSLTNPGHPDHYFEVGRGELEGTTLHMGTTVPYAAHLERSGRQVVDRSEYFGRRAAMRVDEVLDARLRKLQGGGR